MFCQKCGTQLEEGAKFCPKFGAAQVASSPKAVSEKPTNPVSNPVSATASASDLEPTIISPAKIPAHPETFKEKFFSLQGRLNRKPFIMRSLVVGIPCSLIQTILSNDSVIFYPGLLICLVLVISSFTLGARRCHDLNHSGWFQIIPLYVLFMLFSKGKPGPNKYGPDPLA